MTPTRAKEVLQWMGATVEVTRAQLSAERHFQVDADDFECYFEGRFSEEETAAIACWMRDPKGVVEA